MDRRSVLALSGAAVMVGVSGLPAWAETPKDTLVLADFIDDMISLDPAEVFEFSGAEAQAPDLRPAGHLPGRRRREARGPRRRELDGQRRRQDLHLQDPRRHQVPLRQPADRRGRRLLAAARGDAQQDARLHPHPVRLHPGERAATRSGATDDRTLVLKTDKPYAPTFLLYCLTAGVGSVVDAKLVKEHEKDGDFGYDWLKTNSAGSGAVQAPRLEAERELRRSTPTPTTGRARRSFKRVIVRHVPEPATQRLLLEKGDIDIARNLTPEDIAAVTGNADIKIEKAPKGAHLLSRPQPEEPEPRQARGARGAEVAGRLRRAGRTPS